MPVRSFKSVYLYRCVDKGVTINKALPKPKLTRFSQNLIRLIDMNMSLPESVSEMTFDTVLPWILLYHVIKQ